MSSRDLILGRIKTALRVEEEDIARKARLLAEWQALPRKYRKTAALSGDAVIALFDERIRHYRASTFYVKSDVKEEIGRILAIRVRHSLIIPPDFPKEWLPEGFTFLRDNELRYEELNASDGVLTLCTLGIAITGTVVLKSSPEQGRRAATLIPDYHLCLLRRQDIVELVPEAMEKLEPVKQRPLTFFSGPSATVDIEMTRVGGVHGPRTLDVLII